MKWRFLAKFAPPQAHNAPIINFWSALGEPKIVGEMARYIKYMFKWKLAERLWFLERE